MTNKFLQVQDKTYNLETEKNDEKGNQKTTLLMLLHGHPERWEKPIRFLSLVKQNRIRFLTGHVIFLIGEKNDMTNGIASRGREIVLIR